MNENEWWVRLGKNIKFEKWRVQDLQTFLGRRNILFVNLNKDDFIKSCIAAKEMGIPSNLTTTSVWCSKAAKLQLDGGLIRLPDPDTLLSGWEDSTCTFPDLTQTGNIWIKVNELRYKIFMNTR